MHGNKAVAVSQNPKSNSERLKPALEVCPLATVTPQARQGRKATARGQVSFRLFSSDNQPTTIRVRNPEADNVRSFLRLELSACPVPPPTSCDVSWPSKANRFCTPWVDVLFKGNRTVLRKQTTHLKNFPSIIIRSSRDQGWVFA